MHGELPTFAELKQYMKFILSFIVLFSVAHTFGQEIPEKYRADFEAIYASNKISYTNKRVKKWLKENPNDPWAYWAAGKICNPVLEREKSMEFYQKSIAVDSTFGPGYCSLAAEMEKHSKGDTLKAIELYSKAIRFYPDDPFSYFLRADLYYGLGEIQNAIQDFIVAAKHPDMDPMALAPLEVKLLWADHKNDYAYQSIQRDEFTVSSMFWDDEFTVQLYLFCMNRGNQPLACKMVQARLSEVEMWPDYQPSQDLQEISKACQ